MTSRSALTRFGVFTQVGHAPAFYVLMGVLLPITIAALLLASARNVLAANGFGGAQAVGSVAMAVSIGGGLAAVFAGSLADRYSARAMLATVNAVLGVSTFVLWWLARGNDITFPVLLVMAAIDGAMVALSVTATAKVQAGVVGRDAKGAAESVSGIRASAGSLLGVFVSTRVGTGVDSLLIAGALFILVAILLMTVTRAPKSEVGAIRASRSGTAMDFVRTLRTHQELRSIVIADALMFLALPSALLALGIVSEDIGYLNPILVSAGIVGVLAGRLLLAARGTMGAVPRDLTLATLLYAFLALTGFILMQGHWLITQVLLMTLFATVASACGSFVQGLLSAKFQERLPEDLRARGTGYMYGIRAVLLTIGLAFTTQLVTQWALHGYLLVLALALVAVTIGLRGFRQVR